MSKKAKQKKLTILEVKRPKKKFDLTSTKDDARMINAFVALQGSEGWALFRQMMEQNIKVLDKQIITKKSILNDKILTDAEIDELRMKREVYEEVLELPNRTVQSKAITEDTEERDDPYFTRDELIAKRRRVT